MVAFAAHKSQVNVLCLEGLTAGSPQNNNIKVSHYSKTAILALCLLIEGLFYYCNVGW